MSDKCLTDSDCGNLQFCNAKHSCEHVPTFPVSDMHIVMFFLIGLLSGLANVGGIGTGLHKVILFMLLLNYTNKESTSLVYPCLLGLKLSNMIVTIPRKNVEIPWKPMVDYDLCLALLPTMLVGVSIGVLLNLILPNVYLVVIFAVFTFFAFYKTILKSIQFFKEEVKKNKDDAEKLKVLPLDNKKEEQVQEQKVLQNEISSSEKHASTGVQAPQEQETNTGLNQKANPKFKLEPIQPKQVKSDEDLNKGADLVVQKSKQDEESQKKLSDFEIYNPLQVKDPSTLTESEKALKVIQDRDLRMIHPQKLGLIIICWITFFFINYLPGGKGYLSPIGIEKCGPVYWAFFGFQFILAGIWTLIIALMYKSESKIRKEGNHIYHPKEIKYSETPIWKFAAAGTGAGFIIGAAGAGGGMLLVPIVVEMGLNGRSATALSGFMYVFVSGAAVVITLLANKITYQDFLFYCFLTFGTSYVFTEIFNRLIEKFKLNSINMITTAFLQVVVLIIYLALFFVDVATKPWSIQMESADVCA